MAWVSAMKRASLSVQVLPGAWLCLIALTGGSDTKDPPGMDMGTIGFFLFSIMLTQLLLIVYQLELILYENVSHLVEL